jgi:hypothetical protein
VISNGESNAEQTLTALTSNCPAAHNFRGFAQKNAAKLNARHFGTICAKRECVTDVAAPASG